MYRVLPGGWVTLQDVYRCTIDAELFAEKIRETQYLVAAACPTHTVISRKELVRRPEGLNDWVWRRASGEDRVMCRLDPVFRDRLGELEIPFETEETEAGAGSELKKQVEAIESWYPERLDGARCQGPHLDRGRHQRLPLPLRPAAGRERPLSAASGIG